MARAPRADLAPVAVIPAFNAGGTIERAVASALPECREVVVVDDGSTDDTGDIARTAGATVLRQPNAGPATARNTALASIASAGSTLPVIFLDADDELLPGTAETIADAFAFRPTAAAVIASHVAKPIDGPPTIRAPESEWLRARTLPAPGLALGPYHVFCTSGLVLSPGAARALRFDPALHFAEDRDLIYRAAQLGPIALVGRPLVTKHTGRGLTDDPRRLRRWLNDQLALVVKHCPPNPPSSGRNLDFEPLRACTDWVAKHALRTGGRHGVPVDSATWDRVRSVYEERAWPISSSLRRAYWLSRLRTMFTRSPSRG